MQIDNTKLLKLRLSKNITQYKLSQDTGIPNSVINRVESGETKNPRFCTMMEWCKYLDVSIVSIIKQ